MLRHISALDPETGEETILAGDGSDSFIANDIDARDVHLDSPRAVAADGDFVYVAERNLVRVVDRRDGRISTLAGTVESGFSGDGGPASSALLSSPQALAIDSDGSLLIADTGNNRIRRIDPGGTITTVAGNGNFGFSGDGAPAIDAELAGPAGLAVKDGAILVADTWNNRIRVVRDERISTLAGTGVATYCGDGPLIATCLNLPHGLTVADDGSVYVADTLNLRIRRISGQRIETVAGNGAFVSLEALDHRSLNPTDRTQDEILASFMREAPSLMDFLGCYPSAWLAVASAVVRAVGDRFDLGTPVGPLSVSCVHVTDSVLVFPRAVALRGRDVYIADERGLALATGTAVHRMTASGRFNGDGPAHLARLNRPSSVFWDSHGDLLIADTGNERVRAVSALA